MKNILKASVDNYYDAIMVENMSAIIAGLEHIDIRSLRWVKLFNYYFITDGERIFRLIEGDSFAKRAHYNKEEDTPEEWDYKIYSGYSNAIEVFTKLGMSRYDAQISSFIGLFNVKYRELRAKNIKMYLNEELFEELKEEYYPISYTLNGSRKKYVPYVSFTRKLIITLSKPFNYYDMPEWLKFIMENDLVSELESAGVNHLNKEEVHAYFKKHIEEAEEELRAKKTVLDFVESLDIKEAI